MNKIFIPEDVFYVERKGRDTVLHHINDDGSINYVSNKHVKPMLSDIVFKENDNFYVHCQEDIWYYTVGETLLICVQTFKATRENHGFHRSNKTVG